MAAITVIGGINIDIEGAPYGRLIGADSNPGKVSIAFGGVGRNIVENVARMGGDCGMVSRTGTDAMGMSAKQSLQNLGVDVSGIESVPEEETGMYLSILNEKNDMALAICGMDIVERITPEYLETWIGRINQSKIVCVDCNLSEAAIAYLAENVKVPMFLDPVSVTKAERVKGYVHYFHTVKPNRLEAEILTGISITDDISLRKAAAWFMERGVKRVFISLGERGAYYKDAYEEGIVGTRLVELKSATGAGDAFSAAILMGHVLGRSAKETAQMGIACSSIAMEAKTAVNPQMSMEEVEKRL